MKRWTLTLAGLLLLSTLLLAGAGAYLKYDVMAPLGLFEGESIIEVPFLLVGDGAARYALLNLSEPEQHPTEPEQTVPEEPEPPVETAPPETQPEETEPPATEPEPEPLDIDEGWLADALFIGDSRTTGLRDFARVGEPHYFCDVNMTVFRIMEVKVYHKGFGLKMLKDVLEKNQYGKIFIHLGLNECSKDHDLVMGKYRELVELIQEKNPDAKIILQAIMTVTKDKASNPQFSMDKIQDLNDRIKSLAEEKGLIFQDTNEWAGDENGYLREEISMDGAHPTGMGYREWIAWILEEARYMGIPQVTEAENNAE